MSGSGSRRGWRLPTLPGTPLRPKILAAVVAVLAVASLVTLILETRLTREGLRDQAASLAEEQGRALDRALSNERINTGQLTRAVAQRFAVDPGGGEVPDRPRAAMSVLSLVRNAGNQLQLGVAVDVGTGEVFAALPSRHTVVVPGPVPVAADGVDGSQRVVPLRAADGSSAHGLVHVVLVSRVDEPYLLAVGYPLDPARARHLRQLTGADDVDLVVDGRVVAATREGAVGGGPLGDWEQAHEAQVLEDGRTVRYVRLSSDGPWAASAAVGLVIDDPLAALDVQLARTRGLMVALLLVVGGLLAFALVRVLTRPILQLTETATAIAAGDLDRPFDVDRQDEIGTLGRTLERMRRRLRAQLLVIRQQARALQDAARRIVGVQDAERRRVAQDLHDGIQQQLVVLRMQVGAARARLADDPERLDEEVEALADAIDRLLDDLRDTGQALFPSILRDRGLGGALFSLASRTEVALDVRLDPDPLPRVDEAIETNAYFLASEAVTNALKHADAERIVVEVTHRDHALTVKVIDDGLGFDPVASARNGGVTHMRDRVNALGGSLQLRSRPGQGTRVTAVFPLSVGGPLEVEQHRGDAPVELDLLGQAELSEDGVGVLLDGPVADGQLPGDGGVASAGGHEAEDVELPRRQPGQP